MSSLRANVDTKMEAYRLINDPTRLFYLLYTKYGDIEEDYNILLINQLFYNKFSHINAIFKENLFINNRKEFMRRIYKKKEAKDRIPKLNDYYKNYYIYFCRPFLINFFGENLLHHYYNKKAEIFYKNNYSCSEEKKKVEEKIKNSNSNSFSSIDNDTENKTIFDKRNKYIIDNNIETNKYSITLTFDNSIKTNKGILTKRSDNDSFEIYLKNFINEINFKEDIKINKKVSNVENNTINNKGNVNNNFIKNDNHKSEQNKNEIKNNLFEKNEIKKENVSIEEKSEKTDMKEKGINLFDEINKTGNAIFKEINNNNKKLSLKLSRNISKLEELKNNNNILNKKQNFIKEISTNNSNHNSKNKINNKTKNTKNQEKNNKNKESSKITHNMEHQNSPNKDQYLLKFQDYISLNRAKNNNERNHIKILKISKNQNSKSIKQEKFKTISIDKRSKGEIKFKNNDEIIPKINSKKMNTFFYSIKIDKLIIK